MNQRRWYFVVIISTMRFLALCQPGSIDRTFGSDGISILDFDNDFLTEVAIGPDGSIVGGGNAYSNTGIPGSVMLLCKVNKNGQAVQIFGKNGVISGTDFSKNSELFGLAVDKNNNIIFGVNTFFNNENNLTINRINKDGVADLTFANNGKFNLPIDSTPFWRGTEMIISKDQSIFLIGSGNRMNYVLKLTPQGKIDSTFGINGFYFYTITQKVQNPIDFFVDQNGKIIICGDYYNSSSNWNIFVTMLNANGQLDSLFGTNGVATFGTLDSVINVNCIVGLKSGEILLGGSSTGKNRISSPLLILLNERGVEVQNFGKNGALIYNNLLYSNFNTIIVQDDDLFFAGGGRNMVSFNRNGTLNNDFGNQGIAKYPFDIYAMVQDEEGKIITAGDIVQNEDRKMAISRIHTQSTTSYHNTQENTNEFIITPNPATDFITVNVPPHQAKLEFFSIAGEFLFYTNSQKIDISILPPGVYFIRNKNLVKKLIKQ